VEFTQEILDLNPILRKNNYAFPRLLNDFYQPPFAFQSTLFTRRKENPPHTHHGGLARPHRPHRLPFPPHRLPRNLLLPLSQTKSRYFPLLPSLSLKSPLLQPHPTRTAPAHPFSQQNPSPSNPGSRPTSTATSTSPSSTSNLPPPTARKPPPYQTACSKPLCSSGPPKISTASC
jgi:hypothetical protein